MARGDRRDRLEAWQAWWAFVSRVLGFLIGAVIVVSQSEFATLDPWEVAIAAPLMGPAIVLGVVQILTAMRGR